ncbi:MAG: lipopolysaccharide assembly protein LapA domain-containing protein [Xanthomonadales bacterium]|nr:lipopolysaccharide assembly protein LapA domain-containing protein [Xanthomonadales bacterium]
MKKLGFILMAGAAIVVGLLVGTLNSSPVQLDLLWVQFELPLGLAILLGFSLGAVMGLSAIYLVRVLPLRLQLRKVRAALDKQDTSNLSLPDD